MPTYDYVCKFCEHEFEHFQGIHDALLKKCPECGRRGLERKFGIGAGVVFKGSGFYETDYKRQAKAPDKDAAKSGKKETAGSGDGKATSPGTSDGGGAARKPAGKPAGSSKADTKPGPQKSDD